MNAGHFQPDVQMLPGPHEAGGYDEIDRWPNGSVSYLLRGELHRTDGPAFIGADGSIAWLQRGREHRVDGPAVVGPDGDVEVWIDGRRVDPEPVGVGRSPEMHRSTAGARSARLALSVQVRLIVSLIIGSTRPPRPGRHRGPAPYPGPR